MTAGATPADLPADWGWASIADTCERPEYGHTASAGVSRVGPKFLRITDIQGTGVSWDQVPHCECGEPVLSRLALRTGDLLVARIGATTGKAYLVRDCPKAVFASYLIRLRAKAVDPGFLYYFTKSQLYWSQVDAHKADKLKGGISGSVLTTLTHPLPPPAEQRAIARALFELESRVLLEHRRIVALRELKAATMAKLLREGLRGEAVRATGIGFLPQGWGVVPLGSLLVMSQYGLSVRGERSGRVPILRMNCQDDGEVIFRDLQFVELDAHTLERYRLVEGDLLFNRTNSFELVGRTAMFAGDNAAVFASYLIRLRVDRTRVDPRFLTFFFGLAETQERLKAFATRGVSQSNISGSKLKDLLVPLPTLGEQGQIASTLSAIQQTRRSREAAVAELNRLYTATLSDLMTGRIRIGAAANA